MEPLDRRIYENTIAGSTVTSTKDIMDAILKAQQQLRPGIGTRSKLLFTHPNNKKKLGAIVKTVTEAPKDIFVPFPWRVITNSYLPEKIKIKTGKITWKDSRFTTYSSGPAPGSGLSQEEYLSMCKYFGWAEEEVVDIMGWWEMDEPQFSKFMDLAMKHGNQISSDFNKKIALKVFADEGSLLSTNYSRHLLTSFS